MPICNTNIGIILNRPSYADAVAFWRLEESSGTRFASAGSGVDLTANGTPGNATGRIGNAVSLNGTSQYLSLASTSAVQLGSTNFTITAWVYMNSVGGKVLGKDTSGAREYLISANGGFFSFDIFNSSGSNVSVNASTFGGPSTSTWYFVVCQYDDSSKLPSISVNNGTFDVGGSGLSGTVNSSTAEFRIGARQFSGAEGYFNGRIDAVGIWKRKLTSTELTTLYNSGNGLEL